MTELINAARSEVSGTSLTKARIIKLDQESNRPQGAPIECLFNPTEYTITKRNRWKEGDQSGQDTLQLNFVNGEPETLKFQLFFDTYAERKDVRSTHTNRIWELMKVDSQADPKSKKSNPPVVLFQWGGKKSWTFAAVITSITQKFTLFLPDGTPVRATLDVSFQQVRDEKRLPNQNPTSGGTGGDRVWTVVAGDTLAMIAYRMYGNAGAWRPIADANKLTNVRRLVPGDTLIIPNQ